MGIDRLSEWMSKFGYGHYTGIDLSEERSWYQGFLKRLSFHSRVGMLPERSSERSIPV